MSKQMTIRMAAGFMGAAAFFLSPGPDYGQDVAQVGVIVLSKALKTAPTVERDVASYRPKPESVAALRILVDSLHVRAFIATWKPDSLKLAGALARSIEASGNPMISAEYVGVSKDMTQPADLVKKDAVTDVPTFVVFINGIEAGRIVGRPYSAIEDDLVEIAREARLAMAQDAALDMDWFRINPHDDLPIDCSRCHLPPRSLPRPGL